MKSGMPRFEESYFEITCHFGGWFNESRVLHSCVMVEILDLGWFRRLHNDNIWYTLRRKFKSSIKIILIPLACLVCL